MLISVSLSHIERSTFACYQTKRPQFNVITGSAHLSHRYWSVCFSFVLFSTSHRSFVFVMRFDVEYLLFCRTSSRILHQLKTVEKKKRKNVRMNMSWNAFVVNSGKLRIFCVATSAYRAYHMVAGRMTILTIYETNSGESDAATIGQRHFEIVWCVRTRVVNFHHNCRTHIQTKTIIRIIIRIRINRTTEIKLCIVCSLSLSHEFSRKKCKQKREW